VVVLEVVARQEVFAMVNPVVLAAEVLNSMVLEAEEVAQQDKVQAEELDMNQGQAEVVAVL
jgi:hypothetical protein